MKYVFSLGVTAFCLCIALLGFWRAHGLEARELGVLTGGVDALTAGWQAKGVPAAQRAVNFIISDAEPQTSPFVPPPEPGVLDRAIAWFKRNLVGGSPAVQVPTAFAKAFAEEPNVVLWSHEGFSTVSEEAMSREVMKAMVKAHDAGAEVNIVAQGVSAGPVLAGLKRLEGVVRGGVQVGANKVLVVGMDPPRLKRIPMIAAYDFSRLGNVIELANIWTPDSIGGARVRVYGAKLKGAEYEASDLWPVLNAPGAGLEGLLGIIKGLLLQVAALEKVVGQLAEASAVRQKEQAAAQAAALAQKPVTVKSHDGFYHEKEQSGDSLSMIKGGEEYAPAAIQAAQAAKPAEEAAKQPTALGGTDLAEYARQAPQCCAAGGGSWRSGSYDESAYQACHDDQSCQAVCGCCNGADYNAAVPACRAAARAGGGGGGFADTWFRCARQ